MSSGVQVLHFWSETCNPCKVIKPALEDIKEEFAEQVQWFSFNIHKDPKRTAAQLNPPVSVVPTIVVLKNGAEIGRHSGTQVGIYYSIIRKALAA